MNQKVRQTAKNATEKDFYKLLNNANLSYGCRNNLDSCKVEPTYDGIGEITYIKKYTTCSIMRFQNWLVRI